MKNDIFISIIIPCNGNPNLLKETLSSVLQQEYENWECLIVDDGTNSECYEVSKIFSSKDSRFKALQRTSDHLPGGNGARNMGLLNSSAPWIMFLDADDLITRNCLKQRKMAIIKSQADLYVFKTGTFFKKIGDSKIKWNKLQKATTEELILRFIEQDMPWHTNGVLWQKEFINKINGWNEKLTVWQDWEIHMKALFYNPLISFSSEKPDNYYRLKVDDSISSKSGSKEYLQNLLKTIIAVEPFILNSRSQSIRTRFKFLVLRIFVNQPLNRKTKGVSSGILKNYPLRSVTSASFACYFVLDTVSRIRFLKNIIPTFIMKRYLSQVRANSSHLS